MWVHGRPNEEGGRGFISEFLTKGVKGNSPMKTWGIWQGM